MKEFGRSMKKPKLDISITSRSTLCARVGSSSTKATIVRNVSPIKGSTNDFWDDDDDDVILLATQVAEAAVAAEKQQQYNGMNLTESEITFSEFGSAATTSTQRPTVSEIPAPDILPQMFEDDDDDFELLAAVHISDPVEFKKPAPPPPQKTIASVTIEKPKVTLQASEDVMEFVLSQNTGQESTLPSSQSAARRQLASQRQIKFLMDKVDVLKKENSKLSKDLTEAKTKMASKDGEASLLRDELRHIKQQAQTLKMEKILSAQNAQNECQSKMDELAKAVQAKEAEVRMREICEHFGVLEALAVWLNSMLFHVSLDTPVNCLDMLVDLLKSLVFARPSAWIFGEISTALKQCCRLPNALELLCVNSPESTFVADRVRSIYRFSNESCLMQVYCGLLENAFPLSMRLHLQHFKLLVATCLNHVRFVYQCFQRPPKFVQKLLPFYDDEKDDEVNNKKRNDISDSTNSKMDFETAETTTNLATKSNTSSSSTATIRHENAIDPPNPRCECYVKLCLSVVTLIFQLLRQWLLHKKEHCTLQVAEISRLSAQLLHVIFCDNYLACLFRESEETTKHYLSLIVKWWSDNSKQLQFNDFNMKFLQKLQNSHILPKDVRAETNYHNINVDLVEWQKCTNDNVSDLKPPNNAEEAENYVDKLTLIQNASNQNKFFESLKGFAFNFQ